MDVGPSIEAGYRPPKTPGLPRSRGPSCSGGMSSSRGLSGARKLPYPSRPA